MKVVHAPVERLDVPHPLDERLPGLDLQRILHRREQAFLAREEGRRTVAGETLVFERDVLLSR